ncbi:MAG: topoisomerase DNA-binding C4 zinc finger domain-containing protein, partial [Oscillibacter sp.]|nr:topoisomerase DNA-binding C4 zinc finger domain-containing protein [Oscillibacter sp.]
IRPSNVAWTPEMLQKDLTGEQYRLYRLIWNRFVASQMANAVYDSVAVEVSAGAHDFRAASSRLKFAGYTEVYEEGRDEEKEERDDMLPALTEKEALTLRGFARDQRFTQPPAHYTDATLIRAMEEQGIGRPSTYAPTVSTILDRRYVKKEGKYLRITNLGRGVTDWMKTYFPNIEDLKFTADMEKELDGVEDGTVPWKAILREFYGDFTENLDAAAKGPYYPIAPTESDEICPVCGRHLVERDGRFGPFLACPGFPECNFTMPIVEVMPGECPKCGGRLFKRTGISKKSGKQYTYYQCEHATSRAAAATCDFMTWDVPTKDNCPKCGNTMFKRAGKGYKRPFCINEKCENFLPEDKRGYPKKPAAASANAEEAPDEGAGKTARRTAAKKPAAKKRTTKRTAAKKTK